MRSDVGIDFTSDIPHRELPSAFEWVASPFRLSPGIIGFTTSVTVHVLLGAALLNHEAPATSQSSATEISLVQFIPVDIESAHPRITSERRDLVQQHELARAQLRLPIPQRSTSMETPDLPLAMERSTETPSVRDSRLTPYTEETSGTTSRVRKESGSQQGELRMRYESAVFAKIEGAKRYPARARQRKLEGKLTLALHLRPDGGVHSVVITRSSGLPIFDQEALQMVTRAMPFPPAPSGIDPAALTFALPIVFRLHERSRE